MKIKQASIEEAGAISRIHALSWKTAYKGLLPQLYLDKLKEDFWVKFFKTQIKANTLTVQLIYENEVAVGCVAYGKSRDEAVAEWGEIVSVYILPDYFGKGYGTRLLKTALKDMEQLGYKSIYLWVLEGNLKAKTFYEKQGFSTNGDTYQFKMQGESLTNMRYVFSFDSGMPI